MDNAAIFNLINSNKMAQPVLTKFTEKVLEMLDSGCSEREMIERALEYSCDFVEVADFIDAILAITRSAKQEKLANLCMHYDAALRSVESLVYPLSEKVGVLNAIHEFVERALNDALLIASKPTTTAPKGE